MVPKRIPPPLSCPVFGIILLCLSSPAAGEPPGGPARKAAVQVPEVAVPGLAVQEPGQTTPVDPEAESGTSPDPAQLMDRVSAGAVNNNGPLSGQVQYRGMFGPRMNVQVDGMGPLSGGPNWMDPPLHYLPGSLLGSLELERGVSSVSSGGQSMGGTVTARSKRIPFGESPGLRPRGNVQTSLRSVEEGTSAGGLVGAANETHRFQVTGSYDRGGDIAFADGVIAATEHERQTIGAGYGVRGSGNELWLDFRHTDTGDSGNPSLPMDIDFFDTEIGQAEYTRRLGSTEIQARISYQDVDHGMNNFKLRPAPDFNPMSAGPDRRFVSAEAAGLGYRLEVLHPLWRGELRVGTDGQIAEHDMTVRNPDNPGFFVTQFNDAETERYGAFAEWIGSLTPRLSAELGIRYNRVETAAGPVNASPARNLAPPRRLRDAFNGRDRDHADNNVDLVAKLRYAVTGALSVHAEAARKTRSPSYIERYLWLPLEVSAGLADGNNYVGDPDLDPEVAHVVDAGFTWESGGLYVAPRAFYKAVDDYIQGTAATDPDVVAVSTLNGDATPLRYTNVEAEIFGADLRARWRFAPRWRARLVGRYVRGKRRDIDDSLFRIAPPQATLGVTHQRARWRITGEVQITGRGKHISQTIVTKEASTSNAETGSYALFNLRGQWRPVNGLGFQAGVENLLDKDYTKHTSGFNRVRGSDVPVGRRIPGPGRSFYLTLDGSW